MGVGSEVRRVSLSEYGSAEKESFSGDPPLPVARLTPATGHRVFFCLMKKRILLADDDESVRKMVARVLELANYEVLVAATGLEAVKLFRKQSPDLVLLDLRMPELGGWEVFELIHQMNAAVPVVVITAWPDQQQQARQRGIDGLMEKPLDLVRLLERIEELLSETEEQRTQRRQSCQQVQLTSAA